MEAKALLAATKAARERRGAPGNIFYTCHVFPRRGTLDPFCTCSVFFPGAVRLAAERRSQGGEERLRWMTQSWLVALYLECPKHLLPFLHCPNASAVSAFEQAARRGDIWW